MNKITFISDTHTRNGCLKDLPGGDIIIFSGDCMGSGYKVKELSEFSKWFSKQNYTYKVCIAGNHDRYCENTSKDFVKEMFFDENGIIYLQDELVEINGLKIYGTPYQPYFCNWAFNVNDSDRLKSIYKMIPDGVDILVTHCPPYGILDKSHIPRPWSGRTGEEPLGSKELLETINEMENKPKVCVFGHIHGDGGKMIEIDGVKYINASVCDEEYEPVNGIISIEI